MDILYNSNVNVRFVIHNFGKEYYQEVTKFYEDVWSISNVEVEIKECSKVYIEFEAEGEKSSLIVENVFQEGGDPFLLLSGQSKMLFELDNNYSMLVPGSYIIKININGKQFYSMFEIVPRHINDIQLKNLRDFINLEVSNLSYNMDSKLQITNYADGSDYISIIKQYSEVYRTLKYNLNSIMKNPYLTLEKKYVRNGKHEKLNRKAIYLNSKGNKNQDYSYKKVKDYNNKQNIIIKSIAMKMLSNLIEIEEKLSFAYKQSKTEESVIKKDLELKKSSVEKVKDFIFHNKEVEKKIKSYDNGCLSLNNVKKRKEGIKEIQIVLKGLKTVLSNFITSTFMANIPIVHSINYKSVKVEDNRYKSVLKIYKDIYLNKEKKSISYKPSELLYEYFIFLVVVKVFKDRGLTLADCEFKDIVEGDFLDKVPKGCLAKFLYENKEIRVWYEKELSSLPIEAMETNDGFYTHAPNKLPDVRIDFLEENIVKKSIIVESKYRRYSYLWNDIINTHTMIQIKNYKTTVRYVHGYDKKPIFPVEKVIVAYPGQEDIDKVIHKEWGDYTFLQLKPKENDEIYGFEELKGMLEKMI